jgi:hypothetical protein
MLCYSNHYLERLAAERADRDRLADRDKHRDTLVDTKPGDMTAGAGGYADMVHRDRDTVAAVDSHQYLVLVQVQEQIHGQLRSQILALER